MPNWYIKKKDLLNYVEINLRNEAVRTEAGAMRYYQGPIEMKSTMPSIKGFLKSKLAGERAFRPVYEGSGKLVLEPSFKNFFELDLKNERYILDRGAYWASDMGVEADMFINKVSTSIFSGEGIIQTAVSGTGKVIMQAPGEIEVIDLRNDRLVIDGSFAVARSDTLDFSIQQSARSLLGTVTSGEVLVTVLQGTGRVYLAPIPNHTLMLQNIILSSMSNMLAQFRPDRHSG
ncbi:MAG: AIM24 family protein [Rickettsiales bacterium]|nr:AIM24 family protein [Rickettsiales bacterium]